MKDKDTFSSYHPFINFLYFSFVLAFSMIFMHPVCLSISVLCSISYSIYLNGQKAVRFHFLYMLPMFLTAVLINPAFNHEGETILLYLPSDNPLTLESITYGVAAASMLVAVIAWFSCYNTVMTSDKFVYLFGRMIPALSLILSMTLRFVPRFKAQIRVVSNAQKCVGRDIGNGGIVERAKNGITILSIMVTWAMENAIETADSMRSRGYGLPGRTAFSIYRFDRRDQAALIWLLFCGLYVVVCSCLGGMYWRYFPTMKGIAAGVFPASVFFCYFALCITPVIIDMREDRKWNALRYAD